MNRRSKTLVLAGALAAAVAALSLGAQAAGMDTSTAPKTMTCDGMKDCKVDAMKRACTSTDMAQARNETDMGKMGGMSDSDAQCAQATKPHDMGSDASMKDSN